MTSGIQKLPRLSVSQRDVLKKKPELCFDMIHIPRNSSVHNVIDCNQVIFSHKVHRERKRKTPNVPPSYFTSFLSLAIDDPGFQLWRRRTTIQSSPSFVPPFSNARSRHYVLWISAFFCTDKVTRLDYRRSLESGLRSFGGRALAHFPEQRLVIESIKQKRKPAINSSKWHVVSVCNFTCV